jgi:hypothetical protein
VAIAMAYAMLSTYGKKNRSLSAAAGVLRGYNSIYPLTKLERKHLILLMVCRLACSVTLGAYSYQQNPENKYLLLHSGAFVLFVRDVAILLPVVTHVDLPLLLLFVKQNQLGGLSSYYGRTAQRREVKLQVPSIVCLIRPASTPTREKQSLPVMILSFRTRP